MLEKLKEWLNGSGSGAISNISLAAVAVTTETWVSILSMIVLAITPVVGWCFKWQAEKQDKIDREVAREHKKKLNSIELNEKKLESEKKSLILEIEIQELKQKINKNEQD